MKKLFLLIVLMVGYSVYSQEVKIENVPFSVKHDDMIFYLDKDTSSYISVHTVKLSELKELTGIRSDKWHKEPPYGPYNKQHYVKTGYDLGHLTPSDITSYSDSLNYHSFSLFNQAPQLAGFNRGKWAQLEKKVVKTLIKEKSDAIIVTGVIYDNNKKVYLYKSRIKIPMSFYKIIVTKNKITCYIGSNINGEIVTTDLNTIIDICKKNKNTLSIIVK